MEGIPNRRHRRSAMKFNKFFKIKNSLSFKDRANLIKENIKRGNEIFNKNQKNIENSINTQLEEIEKKQIEYWNSVGYDENEIKMLKEANAITSVKYLETWHEDKKTARKLMHNARVTRNKRLING